MTEPLLNVQEVARRLGLGLTATRSLIGSGVVPSLRVGPGSRSIRVRPEDLEAWITALVEAEGGR
ncbi:MAG TPA: helix-turn-helix domain-containing protein [Candidatus Dormibacteraeota bacterium]|nr:helix-turn-helix domain-containing protein [Candidatus Dormibacteraeota bacterium]